MIGSPGYFKTHKPPATPHDLKGMPCIRYRFTSGALYRWEFERGGIEVDIDVEGSLTLNDQDLMVDAALRWGRACFVFEAQVDELIAKRKLVRVLADWCPAYPGFFLYYPSRRQLPAALRAFVDFAKDEWRVARMGRSAIRDRAPREFPGLRFAPSGLRT